MLGLGWQEIAFILVLAIVVVGPDRLPELLRFLGR
jgi:Sec-independent protein translocase protein TatA